MKKIEKARFKCPECGYVEEINIPENVCMISYKCKNCKKTIWTPKESCCIICSYSDKKCLMSSVK